MPGDMLRTTCNLSHNNHDNSLMILWNFPKFTETGSERLSNLPKVTQLVNGRARIGSQAIWFRACVEVVAKGRRSLRLPVREGDVLWWDSEPTAL